jgi:hypothetical protein
MVSFRIYHLRRYKFEHQICTKSGVAKLVSGPHSERIPKISIFGQIFDKNSPILFHDWAAEITLAGRGLATTTLSSGLKFIALSTLEVTGAI